ncbi:PREDICTED: limulus clotting factor C-like [Papilio polytes]|uniref:limulus clotting factor C-like n=1 Tax=Papilio polytes TaxID=76194 RepID=UPI0006764BC2|nr:PREDICTED: limulus clotting factor C-like [Papilio polytes]
MVENPTVSYECTMMFGNNTKSSWPCREYELEGTSANANCKSNYHLGHRESFPSTAKCVDGLWEKLTNCVPAAHCFYDVNTERTKPAENYAVAADKIYPNWNDTRDLYVVKRFVKNIYIPTTYRHADNSHQDDIALLIVDQPFEYSAHIRPVCLDLDLTFEMKHLKPGNMGKVAGWGMIDTSGVASDVLKVVELPVVDVDTCWERAPFDFRSHITSNTFCAGYYNGTALCEGDSGGGLTFPSTESTTIRYYLRGIVSTSPPAPDQAACNAFTPTIFTKVTSQAAFLREFLYEEY